jgi:hypothetical protein
MRLSTCPCKMKDDLSLYGSGAFIHEIVATTRSKRWASELERIRIRDLDSVASGYNTLSGNGDQKQVRAMQRAQGVGGQQPEPQSSKLEASEPDSQSLESQSFEKEASQAQSSEPQSSESEAESSELRSSEHQSEIASESMSASDLVSSEQHSESGNESMSVSESESSGSWMTESSESDDWVTSDSGSMSMSGTMSSESSGSMSESLPAPEDRHVPPPFVFDLTSDQAVFIDLT